MTQTERHFLLIAPDYAARPETGGGQRTILIFRSLKELGNVDVLLIGDRSAHEFTDSFRGAGRIVCAAPLPRGRRGLWRLLRPLKPQAIDALARAVGHRHVEYEADEAVSALLAQMSDETPYDAVVGRYLRPLAKSGALQLTHPILDIDDVDTEVYRTWSERPDVNPLMRMVLRRHMRQAAQLLPPLINRCSHVWVASETDLHHVRAAPSSVLPNIAFPDALHEVRATPAPAQSQIVLFVGIHDHRPNREGLLRFVRACWPEIVRRVPDANLRVVGTGEWRCERELTDAAGVEVIGRVDDLAAEYGQAAFSVVPLFEGGGTKIKIAESYEFGRACVVTKAASRGYESLADADSICVADNEQELVEGCIRLLTDHELRNTMGATGRELVRQHLSFDTFRRTVQDAVDSVIHSKDECVVR